MVGIGFDINNVIDSVLQKIDIINIENPLYPNYLDGSYDKDINKFLNINYRKIIIVDGAYIDLNPGTPELKVREIVRKKVLQSIDFALSLKSVEIIFLSTFLPMIQLDSYDDTHVDNSISFWKDTIYTTKNIKISLCNTFEYNPNILVRIAQGVNNENFGLAFDVGHAFAYGKITLKDFFEKIEPFCSSIYLHSNKRNADEHLNIFEGELFNSREFQEIIPLIRNKNIILKPIEKSRLDENLDLLRKSLVLV
jgi:sugar phosphate isomerase/epimerase